MKHILEGIEPISVMQYFEEICNVPHVSFHTEKITDYVIRFAKNHQLRYVSDASGNVIIFKNASSGYEDHDAVILQGHIDMVGAKTEDSNHDFENDPLELMVEGDFINAKDTTLGGDDGIAVAYMLAILSDDSLKHPALECVFTVNEEVGLLGATALDKSILTGKTMLNLDSEDEGIFTIGCAGGVRLDCILPMEQQPLETDYKTYILMVNGLQGGHSGQMIGTGRPSAVCLLARALDQLSNRLYFQIVSMKAGEVDNAIAPKAEAILAISEDDIAVAKNLLLELQSEVLVEYKGIDDGISFTLNAVDGTYDCAVSDISKEKCIFFMRNMPYGVMARNALDVNLVETSLNPGVLRCNTESFSLGLSIRSSIESAKHDIQNRLVYLTEFLGGEAEASGDYPGWAYNPDSKIRPMIDTIYEEMFGKKAVFETIHAGLECGLFFEGVPNLDIISYGPDMKDIHTFDEKLSISSSKRMYEMTLRILEQL